MSDLLTTEHVDDFILTKENGEEMISIGNPGRRRLREQYLSDPAVHFDLTEGYEHWIDENRGLKRIGVLFDYMIINSPEGNLEQVVNGANFVTRRGVLTNMAMGQNMIHHGQGDWQVVCERRKGVIFMDEEMLPEERRRRRNLTEHDQKTIYWGSRFAEYMVEGYRSNDANEHSTNIPNEAEPQELRRVMSAVLENQDNPIRLMYGGEVDAVDTDGQYVEMKTTKDREPRYGYWFKNGRSVRFWLQSRFLDVSYLIMGVRDDQGHVRELEKLTLDDLYGMQTLQCNGKKCLRFLRDTLATIEEALNEGEAMRVTCIGGRITMVKITFEEAAVLTKKFIDHFKL